MGALLSPLVTGDENTASGYQALYSNTDGDGNTAIGSQALFHNTGSDNVALGYVAGYYLTNGSNNIDIGNPGIAGESHTIRIGNNSPDQTRVFLGGDIYNNFSHNMSLRFVTVDIYGRLGSTDGVAPPPSSRRFKDNVKPMDKASEAILALKPVTFRYKKELDPKGLPQFGLVAEEVQKVNPDLVARDAKGEIYTVRYDAVNAMLLNEFLKEHRTVQELKSTVAKQTATILQQKKDFQEIASQQQKQIDALTAGLQKVSAQLETNKPAPQVVNNP